MIRVSHRATNDSDLTALTKGAGSLVRNLLVVTVPLTLVIFAGVFWLSKSTIVAAVVAGLLMIGSTVSNVRFFRDVRGRERTKDDPTAVEVIEVEAFRVLDIEHLGSHGPAYCFFASDGQALLLVGQWLLERRKFPTLAFRLNRWSDNGEPIRLEPIGKKVKPEQSRVALRGTYKNRDIELFRAAPETLQQDMDNAFGSQ
jgi:hypothetical protein